MSTRSRLSWPAPASLSIGGVGMWLMHFVAMLGFASPGLPVRYEVFPTVLSAVPAVVAVFGGLVVFGVRTKFQWWRLVTGSGAVIPASPRSRTSTLPRRTESAFSAWPP